MHLAQQANTMTDTRTHTYVATYASAPPLNQHKTVYCIYCIASSILFSVWLRSRLPTAWKHAIVIPILKSGKDPHRTSSYRPISLTSTLSKLMERLVTNRLMWYLEKFNLLSNTQSGFRRGRSTADHIVRLQDLITRHQHHKGYVLAAFVDFERAFDRSGGKAS